VNEENSNFSDEWIISHYHKFKIQKAQLLEEIGLLNFLKGNHLLRLMLSDYF